MKRGELLKLYCLEKGQINYPREGKVCLGDHGQGKTIQINYKLNFIQESSQRFSLQFQQLLQFYCITHKIDFSEHVCGNVIEELVFLYRETFDKLLQCVTFLKMLFFHKYFSALFRSFSNFFQSISTSHSGAIQVHAYF